MRGARRTPQPAVQPGLQAGLQAAERSGAAPALAPAACGAASYSGSRSASVHASPAARRAAATEPAAEAPHAPDEHCAAAAEAAAGVCAEGGPAAESALQGRFREGSGKVQGGLAAESTAQAELAPLYEDVWPLHLIDLGDSEQMGILFSLLRRQPQTLRHYLYEHVRSELAGPALSRRGGLMTAGTLPR